ncbi:hypothetical protein [Flagellimonas allohymeniacidonis]|uniref:Uncharacterized protein n=1 Tax=Flagellimonas allohymeniacidonis TaxID=2517819 RepID=A0A4Q8QDC4_9FLAO|nr:hypothetical protein [Allomuricauda hymeniacidonis]TAI48462.1 hypothetical protein EW142_01265 [Allomuricauda hymeniacidonis]
METTEMKKELLYVNKEGIAKTMEQYQSWAAEANNALNEAQKLLPDQLSIEQKDLLLNQGWSALEQLICHVYGHPKAKVNVVLDLNGLDGSSAMAAFTHVPNRHAAVGFTITENGVEVSPRTIDKVRKRHTHYANNERQIEAFKMAQELCETLNEGFANDVYNLDERTRLVNALRKHVELSPGRKEEQVFVPAVKRIAQLKP